MSIDDDSVEEGGMIEKSNHNPTHEDSSSSKVMKWGLLILSCTFNLVGFTVGPILNRLYGVIIIGCVLLGIRRAGDRLPGVTNSQYLVGFFVTLASAATLGFILQVPQLDLMLIGRVGIIFCTSSLFAGVMSTVFLPISQIAAVLTFHDSFPAEKEMALVLTLWGFTSYFYGSYKTTRRQKSATMR
ncbi:probable purine permease 22 [Papaver somniferum]|uniref:probable purine permease 22 n=1 Tax=Papaver somniferum TaxID=3469 RepID=UPI000E6F9683|nr:probable purine permease 22 [Papaver somniferum]